MSERKTWVIPKTKWHARLYRAWREVASFKADGNYRENLCHYWRVVLFWGPVTLFTSWFCLGQTPDDPRNRSDKVPPIGWLLIVGLPIFLVCWAYFTMTWWGATLAVVGIPVLLVLAVLAIEFVPDFFRWLGRNRDQNHVHPLDRQPNVFIETIRAKKHRICPLIQIQNGDES